MSFTAKILMNYPVSIASNVTPPSLFTISKASHAHPCLSLPFKPLSSSSLSFPNFLSLKKQKEPLLRVSAIADMEEEDDIPDVFEDQEQEFEGDSNWGDSENDGFGEQDEEAEAYAGNLPYDVTGEQFETFNEAADVEIAVKEPRSRDSVIAARGEENKIIRDVFEDLEQESEGDLNWGASEDYGSGEENDEAKVYVGNLAYNVTGEQLAETFNKAGVVEMAEIKVHRDTNLSRGFAFVTMSSVEEAEKAMEMFDNYEINGREIIVRKAARRGSKPERLPPVYRSKSKIYVGSLPWSVDDDRLEELFSAFGRVISARVVSDMENGGRSRGFGFVEMSNDSEMNLAISNLDGQIVDGRPIRVNVATENRRSSF